MRNVTKRREVAGEIDEREKLEKKNLFEYHTGINCLCCLIFRYLNL